MNYSEFRKAVNPSLKGAYLFFGDEDYLKKDAVARARTAVITDYALKDFQHIVVSDAEIHKVAAELDAPSLFSDNKLIELYGVEPFKMKESDFELLLDICKRATDALLIIVVNPGKFSGKKKSYSKSEKNTEERISLLSSVVTLVEFEKESPQKLAKWVAKHFEASKIMIYPDVAAYIVSYCGTDMFILKNEIDKMIGYILSRGGESVTKEIVNLVASSYTEIGAFDFVNSLLSGNKKRAFTILSDMKMRKEPVQIILSAVSKLAGELLAIKAMVSAGANLKEIGDKLKIKEYPLKLRLETVRGKSLEELSLLVERCYDADLTMKSSSLNTYVVLENLLLSM